MKMYILIGAPGSGKSTWAAQHKHAIMCSADSYFTKTDGSYSFRPELLSEAHGECFRNAMASVQKRTPFIIIDNTNTTLVEISPYMAIAKAYGYDARPLVFVGRYQNQHGVPDHRVDEARERVNNMLKQWPVYWPKPILLNPEA